MKQEIIEALVGAITKWDLIAQSIICEQDRACPLCKIFYNEDKLACDGCPVQKESGADNCEFTPYQYTNLDSDEILAEDLRINTYNLPDLDKVEDEIEFLISLLPKDSKEAKRYQWFN